MDEPITPAVINRNKTSKIMANVKGRVNSYQCGGVKVYHSG